MKCDHTDNDVKDSRSIGDSGILRRRRKCADCGYRWTTYEVHEEEMLKLVDIIKSMTGSSL